MCVDFDGVMDFITDGGFVGVIPSEAVGDSGDKKSFFDKPGTIAGPRHGYTVGNDAIGVVIGVVRK